MTRSPLLHSTLILALIGTLVFTTGCDNASVFPNQAPDAQEEAVTQNLGAIAPQQAASRSTAPVFTFGSMDEVGTSRLVRTEDAIAIRTSTTELVHRHVTTLWWVIFNNPENCTHGEGGTNCGESDLFDEAVKASCPYADGSIVGGNGHARFQDRLKIGEDRNSCLDFFGAKDHGLKNPKSAEIHVVVRSHGPLIPGMVSEMRSTFAGACEDFLDQGVVPEKQGQCADLQFAVHTPPE